ncbi:MAG: deoxyuridine 5'-triphosphate nucleotidohydrolase [Eubacteriales bacterium]
MEKIAKFEKVSFEQFKKDFLENADRDFTEEEIKKIYDSIKLPTRATTGSAGYDIFTPEAFSLKPNEMIKIVTGIRVKIEEGWVLTVFPRSGLGFKYRLQLNNTIGVIDADYYDAENEGHIMVKLTNDTKECKTVVIDSGTAFAQGIFLMFGITKDDEVTEKRTGGFGSTGM